MPLRLMVILLALVTAVACSPSESTDDANPTGGAPSTGAGGSAPLQPTNPTDAAHVVDGGCAQGQADCGGRCIDTLSNPAHCGGCNLPCAVGASCVNGACALGCAQGQSMCEGGCTTTVSDPANCGSCGQSCAPGQFCDAGVCSATCSGIQCPGPSGAECVDAQSNPDHCGMCGIACPAGSSCVAGQCALVCQAQRTGCSGACVDVSSDPANCGSCGVPCPAGTPCIFGSCGCTGNQILCDGQCVDPLTDPAHCGSCAGACGAGTCVGGACQCSATETLCAGQCVDTSSDANHCGGCLAACAPGQVCASGVCSDQGCPLGSVQCGSACIDIATDRAHCGGCEQPCPTATVCSAGQCVCAPTMSDCSGTCVDTTSSPQHCGGCGNACPLGSTCVAGACQCAEGTSECNQACVDLSASDDHCGACDSPCDAGLHCVAAECTCDDPSLDYCGELGCIDLTSSNENCGACGVACVGGQHCSGGNCVCDAELAACGETCIDTQTNLEHCGGCDAPCPENRSCVDGECSGLVGDGPDDCAGAAHSISVSKVVLYQGVEVALMESGGEVPPSTRNADVIQGRDAIARVFVELAPGWTNREVSVRLYLTTDGEEHTLYSRRELTTSSSQEDPDSTAQMEVPAELIAADTRYAVEVVECTAGPEGTIAAPRFPADGELELGARRTGTVEVMFVPVAVDTWEPDTSESVIDGYREYIEAMYPTTEVVTSLTDTMRISSGFDWSNLLDQLRDRRASEGVADEVYFYGLVRPSNTLRDYCGFGCTAGIGFVTDAGGWSAGYRVACGLAYGDEESASTMAHEIGHNHGREHTPCNVAGDPAYPYEGGSIGSWGYDKRSGGLFDPSMYADIMGYCNPTWVSDWTYQAFADRVATMNGAVSARLVPPSAPELRWRVLLVSPGNVRWGLPYRHKSLPSGTPMPAEALGVDGAHLATLTAYATRIAHGGGTVSYLVPPPEADWHSIQIDGEPAIAYP